MIKKPCQNEPNYGLTPFLHCRVPTGRSLGQHYGERLGQVIGDAVRNAALNNAPCGLCKPEVQQTKIHVQNHYPHSAPILLLADNEAGLLGLQPAGQCLARLQVFKKITFPKIIIRFSPISHNFRRDNLVVDEIHKKLPTGSSPRDLQIISKPRLAISRRGAARRPYRLENLRFGHPFGNAFRGAFLDMAGERNKPCRQKRPKYASCRHKRDEEP